MPREVAHRIAAGEVIERPTSAVKELVENALDAGATRVEVAIEGGGVALLQVRDHGSGMSPEDAERAVGRHATSKISTAEDLLRVVSLGFRGEALHAISSVLGLTLTTRELGPAKATRVQVLAGGPPESSPAAHPEGTTVEVRDLFMNLPVRRCLLGSKRAETNGVIGVVEALALSRPQVSFFCERVVGGFSRCRRRRISKRGWRRSTVSRWREASCRSKKRRVRSGVW